MYNVLILVGMVFGNVFLGINYLIVYKLGGEFGLIYGIVIVIMMLYVIKFNVILLKKFSMWLKYEVFWVVDDYVMIVCMIGLIGDFNEELINKFCDKIKDLVYLLGVILSLKVWGVDKVYFDKVVDYLVVLVYED